MKKLGVEGERLRVCGENVLFKVLLILIFIGLFVVFIVLLFDKFVDLNVISILNGVFSL